ncbi:MAG TPA: hypothetical protein VJX28_03565 [Chthoniobacterales bacterium]|nr:hypothetical protein [Chthoniobacterales bacterium]
MLEKPDEHRGGRYRIVIGSSAITTALLLLERQFARLEPCKEILRGEPCGEHPIRPAGEGAQQVVDTGWPIALDVKPVGKGVDVISGETRAESPPGDR